MSTEASGGASLRSWMRLGLVLALALLNIGWSYETVRYVAWSSVDFFPPDLAAQVRKNHRRFDAGIRRGLAAQPSWRAASPGFLEQALSAQAESCAKALHEPIPLDDLVEELGVLAARIMDANDPLAVSHSDPREPHYSAEYAAYADSLLSRVRLVYYGLDRALVYDDDVEGAIQRTLERGRSLYSFVGDEFYRTGSQRNWRDFDDKSVAFGVAAVSLSRGMTDLANFSAWIWNRGGGAVPTPRPTPPGHVGPTVTVAPLGGGFPEREKPAKGKPAMPSGSLVLPPP